MSVKTMPLRRDGSCVVCLVPLPAGSRAQWDTDKRTVTCLSCVEQPSALRDQLTAKVAPQSVGEIDSGVAGGSAQREYERRHAKRDAEVRDRHPRIGGLILALSDEPQSTTAWAKGAVGERKVGDALESLRPEGIVVLHDRRVPRSRANIDHLVAAPSGIHVIDAKRLTGKVEIRSSGSIFRPGPNLLYVGGRNQTKLVEKLAGQVDVVRAAVERVVHPGDLDSIVRPALCFVDAEWGWFQKPETLQGVRISWPTALLAHIRQPGPLTPDQVLQIGSALADALEPA